MDMKKYFTELSPEAKKSLALAVDTSVAYLSPIANGHRSAGIPMAKLIEEKSGGIVTKEELRPDVYSENAA